MRSEKMPFPIRNRWLDILFAFVIALIVAGTACSQIAGPSDQATTGGVDVLTPTAVTEVPIRDTTTPSASSTPKLTAVASVPTPTERPIMPTEIPRPSPTATPDRTPYQIEDSSSYMAMASVLWHPNDLRTTMELPIEIGNQPWSPDGRQLVGWSREQKSLAILTLDTGELSLVENTSAWYDRPFWSPNGRFLSYLSPIEVSGLRGYQIGIYDLEAQKEMLIGEQLEVLDWIALAGWSPDSTRVALIKWATTLGERVPVLEVIDIDTLVTQQFTSPEGTFFEGATWSPIHDKLLVYGNSSTSGVLFIDLETYAYNEIYLIDLSNGAVEQLKEPSTRLSDYYAGGPGYFINNSPWSPDGEQIIYGDRGVICYMTLESRAETCLTDFAQATTEMGFVGSEYPSWSPTGEWIGFIFKLESIQCSPIAAIHSDGSDLRITNAQVGDCSVFGPIWSPRK